MLDKLLMCVTNEEIPKDPPRYLYANSIDTETEGEDWQSFNNCKYLREYLPEDEGPCLIHITLVDGTEILRTKQNFSGGCCDCCSHHGEEYESPVDRVRVYRILSNKKEVKQ